MASMRRLKIALLYGGISAEREVSLNTGQMIAANLDPKKYDVTLLDITADGDWAEVLVSKREEFDLAFNALHGTLGEDGLVQGFLESIGLLYTGSGVLSSSLGFDKRRSREIFKAVGITVPKTVVVSKKYTKADLHKVIFPAVVKPNAQGSSVGVAIVKNFAQLNSAIKKALKYDTTVLVEEYLPGTEVTVGVFGNSEQPKTIESLPLVEIVPGKKYEFFDYEAKYQEGASAEIVPARITKKITAEISKKAVEAYLALGCRGYARVDFIIKDNTPYLLEVNTLPGMTVASLFPKAAKASGYTFPQTLEKIISLALKSY